jgi:hypothetical protein
MLDAPTRHNLAQLSLVVSMHLLVHQVVLGIGGSCLYTPTLSGSNLRYQCC